MHKGSEKEERRMETKPSHSPFESPYHPGPKLIA